MDFKFEKKIDVKVSLEEVFRLIDEKLLEKGYKAISIKTVKSTPSSSAIAVRRG